MEAFRDCRRAMVAAAVVSIFANILLLALPLYLMLLFDKVLASRSLDTLFLLTVLVVFLLSLHAALIWLRGRILARAGARLEMDLYERVLTLGVRDHGKPARDHSPVRDLGTIRSTISGSVVPALFDLPLLPIFLFVTLLLHPMLGLVGLIGAGALGGLALLNLFVSRGGGGSTADRGDPTSTLTPSQQEVMATMGLLPNVRDLWTRVREDGLSVALDVGERSTAVSSAARLARILTQVALLAVGAYLAIGQTVTIGVIVAASMLMARALAPLEAALGGLRSVAAAHACYRRLKRAISLTTEDERQSAAPIGAGNTISVSRLVVLAPNTRRRLLSNVSFAVEPGSALGIMGNNGSGKTLLARCLLGMIRASTGDIAIGGQAVGRWPPDELGRFVGYMPQGLDLLPGSLDENIARFGPIDRDAVAAAAKAAGAHDAIGQLPLGYATRVDEIAGAMPGGLARRIALARAIYGNPPVAVLDDPGAGLDVDGVRALRLVVRNRRSDGLATIVISQQREVLVECSKLLVLRDGTVDVYGDAKDLADRQKDARIAAGSAPRLVDPAAAIG